MIKHFLVLFLLLFNGSAVFAAPGGSGGIPVCDPRYARGRAIDYEECMESCARVREIMRTNPDYYAAWRSTVYSTPDEFFCNAPKPTAPAPTQPPAPTPTMEPMPTVESTPAAWATSEATQIDADNDAVPTDTFGSNSLKSARSLFSRLAMFSSRVIEVLVFWN